MGTCRSSSRAAASRFCTDPAVSYAERPKERSQKLYKLARPRFYFMFLKKNKTRHKYKRIFFRKCVKMQKKRFALYRMLHSVPSILIYNIQGGKESAQGIKVKKGKSK